MHAADRNPPPVPAIDRLGLFLDYDGTLADFHGDPAQATLRPGVVALLARLHQRLGGALALVSGRPITDLDRFLAPLLLPAAGLHGLERRGDDGRIERIGVAADVLEPARVRLRAFVAAHPALLLEDKRSSLVVHYARAPGLAGRVAEEFAQLLPEVAPAYRLLGGHCMLELRPAACDKATAVDAFMREAPFRDRRPVFVGDDITDQDGFRAVERHGGIAIGVGDRLQEALHLPDPAAVHRWLALLLGESVDGR